MDLILAIVLIFIIHKATKRYREQNPEVAESAKRQELKIPDEYRSMSESDLLHSAYSGNAHAMCEYGNRLIDQKEFQDALTWYLKGAEAGNALSMEMFARTTIIDVEISLKIDPRLSVECLGQLQNAERWLMKSFNAGNARAKDALNETGGIYDMMVWCNFISSCREKDTLYYQSIISAYSKVTNPTSRSRLAYIKALEETGNPQRAVQLAVKLDGDFDHTMTDPCKEMLYTVLVDAYLQGRYVRPSYEKSLQYVNKLKELMTDPEDLELFQELQFYFESGQAKEDYDNMRKKELKAAVINGLRK